MDPIRVLTIEDDPAIRQGLVDALQFNGYQAIEACDGPQGARLAVEAEYELVLLDLVLPGRSGLDILKDIRRHRPNLPVIILTALGAESDRIRGLELGADDYVVKPFSIKELLARMRAVLRRSPERPNHQPTFAIPGATVHIEQRQIRFDDGGIEELSQRECELLGYLAAHADRVISREEILTRVWRLDPRGIETRTIDMHIARLREKLGDDPANPKVIRTIRGFGYVFVTTGQPPAEGGP